MGFSLTSFIFEIANFLVLMWILNRLVFKPLKKGVQQRRDELKRQEDELAAALLDTREREAGAEALRRDIESLRDEVLREATHRASEERARLLAQAREDADAERARARRMLSVEREAAANWVRELAVEHGAQIAGRMLMEISPDGADTAIFERLLEEVERRRDELRATGAEEVEATFAHLPSSESVGRLRHALAACLEQPPHMVLRDDEGLIAGVVLRVGHLVLDASILGQLDVFRDRVRGLLEQEARVA
ncbi:MAG: F0F1 ATP synthase subunit delta [Myxococcales bacterium]|nr:F0F1 ATP synthase subunit delta [Myxococcales bacterium]